MEKKNVTNGGKMELVEGKQRIQPTGGMALVGALLDAVFTVDLAGYASERFYNSFSGGDGNFVILTQAARVVEPSEGAFNNPAPVEFLSFAGLDFR